MPVNINPRRPQPVVQPESSQASEAPAAEPGAISAGRRDSEARPAPTSLRQRRSAIASATTSMTRWQKLALVIRLGIKPPPIKVDERKLHANHSQDQYQSELRNSLRHYKTAHTPAWYQPGSQKKESEKAWLMYQAARDNHLGLLVLGKSDIRTDADMVTNFGYTSVHGTESGRPDQLAWEGTQRRRAIRPQSDELHNETLGPGSILCDKDWSPMLNDAFILGGIHGDNQFELTLPFAVDHSDHDISSHLDENPQWLWPEEQSFPSVLMRELTGLQLAGYQAHFSEAGLTFVCTRPQLAQEINHELYLKALDSLLGSRQHALLSTKNFLSHIVQVPQERS